MDTEHDTSGQIITNIGEVLHGKKMDDIVCAMAWILGGIISDSDDRAACFMFVTSSIASAAKRIDEAKEEGTPTIN